MKETFIDSGEDLLDEILQLVTFDEGREAQWLDMLSQLEFIGCRKIIKSVGFGAVTVTTLQHIAEESSHAFLLKSQASKLGRRSVWPETALSQIGWDYFQNLDQSICEMLEDPRTHYPAVSWIIEKRVVEVYPRYADKTRHAGVRRVLLQILAQEKRHAEQFSVNAFPEWFEKEALRLESELWSRFAYDLIGYFRVPTLDTTPIGQLELMH